MTPSVSEIDQLTERIIRCAIEVHRTLGPGLLESVYRECMIIELRGVQPRVESERHVPLEYKGERISGGLKLDLLVEGCVVVELKAVDHSATLKAGLRRLAHPDRYGKKGLPTS